MFVASVPNTKPTTVQYLARKGLADVSDVEREGGGRKYKGASVRNSEGCGGTVEVNCNERLHDRGRKMDEEESRMYVGEREREKKYADEGEN